MAVRLSAVENIAFYAAEQSQKQPFCFGYVLAVFRIKIFGN